MDFALLPNMTLDLSFQLTGLPQNGEPAPDLGVTAGRALAQALMSSTKGDALKQYEWAILLSGCGKLTLDTSDRDALQTFVRNNETLTTIAKGPILKAISELK